MEIINPRSSTDDADEVAIRTELLGIFAESPHDERTTTSGVYETAVEPSRVPVTQVYRVGGLVCVYRPDQSVEEAARSVDLVLLASSSVTPSHRVRVGSGHWDVLQQDLSRVIGEIRAMQDPVVSDEYRALAEAVCASSPGDQTDEQLHAWASRLATAISDG